MFAVLGVVLFVYAQAPQFSPAPGLPVVVGEGSGFIVLADVNRDGKLDLITQHLQQRAVTVQLGDGTGRFAPAPGSPIKLAYSPGDIKLGDVNGDGVLDLAVTGGERDSVDIFIGDGNGGFNRAPGAPFLVSASTEFNTGLQLMDINSVTVLINGNNGFAPAPGSPFHAGPGAYHLAIGDVNRDGKTDIAASSFEGKAVTVLLGR